MANYFDTLFKSDSKDGISLVFKTPKGFDLEQKVKDSSYAFFRFMRKKEEDSKRYADYWLCIKKNALPKSGKVVITVPEEYIAAIVGKGGNCIKQIASKLGVSYINVVG